MKNLSAEEQKKIFAEWLVKNRENLVTIKTNDYMYNTFDKTSVEEIQIVSREKKDCPRVWFKNGSYQDFPEYTKEELERIILS